MTETAAFLMKDFVLLAACFYLLKQDLVRLSLLTRKADGPSETLDTTHTQRKTG
jgi:hypothetical protein